MKAQPCPETQRELVSGPEALLLVVLHFSNFIKPSMYYKPTKGLKALLT